MALGVALYALLIFGENELLLGGFGGVCLLDEGVNVNLCKLAHYVVDARLSLGMSGSEDGTAILKGKDRGFEGAVAASLDNDLILIHADTGTEDGDVDDRVGDLDSGEGLGCNLTKALTGDEGVAMIIACDALGEAHHEDSEKNGEVILLTLIAQLLLYVG